MTGPESMRTDRVGLLLDQLDSSWELGRARLAGLTDVEYLWEPWPGMWSVRRRADAIGSHPTGAGGWVRDGAIPEPDPAPLTTIAWRLGHLASGTRGRWEWTFGGRSIDPGEVVEPSPTAGGAISQLSAALEAWAAGISTLSDEQLDTVGFGQYPWGLDPQLPIIAIVWWVNRELIHHLAEVALLRDLYSRVG